MLNRISIQNFKSINIENPIELKEFSIICGSNSSGKSSLLQAILMLSQSFSSRYQDEPITLNGPFIRLGSFRDIKKHDAVDDEIQLSISLPMNDKFFYKHDKNEKKFITNHLKIGVNSKGKNKKEDEFHPLILENKVIVSMVNHDGALIETDRIELVLNENSSDNEPSYLVKCFKTSEKNSIDVEFPGFEIIESQRGALIPSSFKIEYDYVKKISGSIINLITSVADKWSRRVESIYIEESLQVLPKAFILKILEIIKDERRSIYDSISVPDEFFAKSELDNFLRDEKKFLSELKDNIVNSTYNLNIEIFPSFFNTKDYVSLDEWEDFLTKLDIKSKKSLIELIDKNRKILQEIWYKEMPKQQKIGSYTSQVFNEVERILSFYFARSVKYLGPLRIEPQAIYSSLGHYDPNTVGLKGEFTAAVLHKNKEILVSYLSPSLIDEHLKLTERRRPLRVACQEWLSYLGVIQEFNTADKGKLGYELNVKTHKDEKWQDLTHVGVGVSQVLPIVLMFLLSEEDDILIFEQPELHLHPQVQSRLCDLFIAMSASRRQCIIETHSEYLINRLRLRIAQEEDTKIQDTTSMYFISKISGTSEFTSIEINKYGTIIDWPKDFFDQTDREIESILYEASMKRKKDKNKEKKSGSSN
ncbi:TPA: DUF3696 domain-containing protein [Klebsiella pneumoniae]|uniref:DUF3696 domain-containing protein n=1 Tax=Klebsiella pneumoniae TaxID=573 RepID=UPI0021536E4E|nr:DUF3696 domain-containing protein [Klebsiella pneumoniae]HBZ7486590.1 DUF3696 domain-containing protein [Klebsiella pneumoniae]